MRNRENVVQPEEFGVLEIFKGTEYRVPIYQRNYAWTKDEIEQLLNDINDIDDSFEGKYYLGSLIVNQLGANYYDVIDGQQRLTTLFLMLSFLNNASINKRSLTFEAREKSNRTLYEIDAIKDTEKELDKEPWYSEEIIDGYAVIKNFFNQRQKKDANFTSKFKERLKSIIIIRTQVPRDIDLNHYFEIMNTRGEQLELHEIVKAKIISAIKSENEKADKKDKMIAATIWDACAQMDNYVQMNFSANIRNKLFSESWDYFDKNSFKDIKCCFEDEQYTDNKKFKLFDKLKNPVPDQSTKDKSTAEENERFESIVSFPNFILLVNEALNISETDNDAGLDDKRFMKLLEDKWRSREAALDFVFSLLKYRFLFDRFIIKREFAKDYKTEGRWALQRLEMYFDAKKNSKKPSYKGTYSIGESDDADNRILRMLEACLRITYTSPKTMHWISRVLAAANSGYDNANDLKDVLEKYCCKKVAEAEYEKSKGFGIDRIVFTFLDYLICRDNPRFDNYQFQFRTSIEHFYPQHPINDDVWDDEHLNSFGNLALITVSANSKFSNMLPSSKVENYSDIIEQSPKLVYMRILMETNGGRWNKNLVEQHNQQMIDILKKEIEKWYKIS